MAKVLGVIAEYNPLHEGHYHHLKQAIAQTGCQYVIIAMSGNFVQRGEPAIVDKWVRAKMAVAAGADLVLELPAFYALQSAENFARAGIDLLKYCQVGWVSFGSESGNIADLEALARWLQTPQAQSGIRNKLAAGITYAAAIEKAAGESTVAHLSTLLKGANNILAVEYLRALSTDRIGVHTVKREKGIPTASQIRRLLVQGKTAEALAYIPSHARDILAEELSRRRPVAIENFTQAIYYTLASKGHASIRQLPACSEGLENRIMRALGNTDNLNQLLNAIKTKRYPLTRIQRLLMQGLLHFDKINYSGPVPYLRVLASSPRHKILLPSLSQSGVPLLYSARDEKRLGRESKEILEAEIFAQKVYQMGLLPLLTNPVAEQ